MAPQFGFCLPIFAAPGLGLFRTPGYPALDTATTMDLAARAEALGYDSLWVADHLMLGEDDAILEGWTTLAALAGRTSRPRLGLIHQAHPFRHPALAAKMIATLDQISGGRFIYFLDVGNRRAEYVAYGLPWSDAIAERAAWMIDGLELTLALWSANGPVDYDGPHYQLRGAVCAPPPLQQPHPPIWFGGVDPALLSACARYGQGWNTTPVSPAQLRDQLAALEAACAEAGRSVADLEKTLEIQILIAPDCAAVRERLRAIAALDPAGGAPDPALAAFIAGQTDEPPPALRRTTLIGTPDEVTDQVRAFVDLGIGHFMLWFLDAPTMRDCACSRSGCCQRSAPRVSERAIRSRREGRADALGRLSRDGAPGGSRCTGARFVIPRFPPRRYPVDDRSSGYRNMRQGLLHIPFGTWVAK